MNIRLAVMQRWMVVGVGGFIAACTNSDNARKHDRTGVTSGAVAQESAVKRPAGQSVDSLLKLIEMKHPAFQQEAGEWFLPEAQERFPAFTQLGDSGVARLVECLTDNSPSSVTINGHNARRAVLCNYVLGSIAYYEAFEDRPAGPQKYAPWRGDVDVQGTEVQYRRAQDAWKEVLGRKTYRLR